MPLFGNDAGTVRGLRKVWANDNGTVRELSKVWGLDGTTPRLLFENISVVDVAFTTNQQEFNLINYLTSVGGSENSIVTITINTGVYFWSSTTATAGFTVPATFAGMLTVINNGNIIGHGGLGGIGQNGIGGNGGIAFNNLSPNAPVITNSAGAFIAGGGGGGGGGTGESNSSQGGGGTGQAAPGARGAGIVTGGCAGVSVTATTGAAGHGGSYRSSGSQAGFAGQLSGSQLPGVASAGGQYQTGPDCDRTFVYQGSISSSGSAGNAGRGAGGVGRGGQGGGWGANGGGGRNASNFGLGGAAISGTSTLTNNGTIYGST